MVKEKKDLSILFEEINHTSLNHIDLLNTFLDYSNRDNVYNYKLLNKNVMDTLLNYPEVIEYCVMSCREAVMFGMLSITLDSTINEDDYKLMYIDCLNISAKKTLLNKVIKELENLKLNISLNLLEKEYINFMKNFEKEIYSIIVSKNKDIIKYTKLNKLVIQNRKNSYFEYIEMN